MTDFTFGFLAGTGLTFVFFIVVVCAFNSLPPEDDHDQTHPPHLPR